MFTNTAADFTAAAVDTTVSVVTLCPKAFKAEPTPTPEEDSDDDVPLSFLVHKKNLKRKVCDGDSDSDSDSDSEECIPRSKYHSRSRKQTTKRRRQQPASTKWLCALRQRKEVPYKDREGAITDEHVMAMIAAFYVEGRRTHFTDEMHEIASDVLYDDREGFKDIKETDSNTAVKQRLQRAEDDDEVVASLKVFKDSGEQDTAAGAAKSKRRGGQRKKGGRAKASESDDDCMDENEDAPEEEYEVPTQFVDRYEEKHEMQFNKSERRLFQLAVTFIDRELVTAAEAGLWKHRFPRAMQPGDRIDRLDRDDDDSEEEEEVKQADCSDVEGDEADEDDVVDMSEDEADERDAKDAAFVVDDVDARKEKGNCECESWEFAEEDEAKAKLMIMRSIARSIPKEDGVIVAGRTYVFSESDSEDDNESDSEDDNESDSEDDE
eukprot:3940812-Rhodomonas_salina.1